jgi:DNA-binding transcriptional ArsR family regulator
MTEISRDFKGIWIPRHIWLHPELSIIEKCLAAEIDSLDGDEGCHASNAYLAKFLGVTERNLQKHLSKLKKLGVTKTIRCDGRKTWRRGYSKLLNAGELGSSEVSKTTPHERRKRHPPLPREDLGEIAQENKEERKEQQQYKEDIVVGLRAASSSKDESPNPIPEDIVKYINYLKSKNCPQESIDSYLRNNYSADTYEAAFCDMKKCKNPNNLWAYLHSRLKSHHKKVVKND